MLTPEIREKILTELAAMLLVTGGKRLLPSDPNDVKRSMGNAVVAIKTQLLASDMSLTSAAEIESVITDVLAIVLKRAYPRVFIVWRDTSAATAS